MDFNTFSRTYWYIWLLIVLFVGVFLLINVGGILYYRKKRNQFLTQSKENNLNSSMRSARLSRYRPMSNESSPIEKSSFTITTNNNRQPSLVKSEELITSTPNSMSNQQNHHFQSQKPVHQYTVINEKDFQHQALAEHNFIRALHNKPTLKLNEKLNSYAQSWTNQCAQTNIVVPSRLDWRLNCHGQPFGENIISTKSTDQFDGIQFTRMILAYGDQSEEVHCLLNEVSTEVGFGFASSKGQDNTQQQWIGVAHYYPFHQLTIVQP